MKPAGVRTEPLSQWQPSSSAARLSGAMVLPVTLPASSSTAMAVSASTASARPGSCDQSVATTTTRLLAEGHDAVTSRAFGAIQRLVGRLEHFIGVAVLGLALGHADADSHRHRGVCAAPATLATG
ncbi:hypothetical protein WR25_20732 [Diploscapter pachys]|uniref:Uncharacterized protein n=1 Tax=Diploscapter pachys TaxID=2018661 RepID=A0A2A2K7Q7_9BILA|nr:hypothetical protein WR25_20732 [Diploscapter pachys]